MTNSVLRRRYPGQDPRRRAIGWIIVAGVHALVIWALVTGTARKGLSLIKKPMEAAVIQEVIIPPPPPPPPPPKKIEKVEPKHEVAKAPPPPFVPPPEVAPPVTSAPSIQSVQTPPPVMAPIAPPPPPAPAPAPAGPTRADIGVVCPTQAKPEMPPKAVREGTEGVVKAQVLVRDGAVREVTILSGPRVFHAAVREAMLQYKCNNSGDAIATQEFVFKIE